MFKARDPLTRFLFNFLITWALFGLFAGTGWITITSALPLWEVVLFTGLLSIVATWVVNFVSIFAAPLIVIFVACTLGLGLLLYPGLIMYLVLYLVGTATGLFTLTTVWWQVIILGTAFALLRFTSPD